MTTSAFNYCIFNCARLCSKIHLSQEIHFHATKIMLGLSKKITIDYSNEYYCFIIILASLWISIKYFHSNNFLNDFLLDACGHFFFANDVITAEMQILKILKFKLYL